MKLVVVFYFKTIKSRQFKTLKSFCLICNVLQKQILTQNIIVNGLHKIYEFFLL